MGKYFTYKWKLIKTYTVVVYDKRSRCSYYMCIGNSALT